MKKIQTIVRKEWAEVFKNRMVLFTVVFLPLILTVIPLGVLYGTRGSEVATATSGLPAQLMAGCRAGLTAGECFQVYMVSQFLLMFMILPAAIPATIAAYSIVGEKTTRSLEPLLATPITTAELLIGKSLAAAIPAILATFGAFVLFAIGAWILIPNKGMIVDFLDARWLLAIFIVGPLMAILAVSVSIMVSSRVNDPRVAEQLSMVVILPVMLLFFSSLSGLVLVNKQTVLIIAAILVVFDTLMVYFGVKLFQRETILTRWK